MCGEENLNYSPCKAMAPPLGEGAIKPARKRGPFPLFHLNCAKNKNPPHDPDWLVIHSFFKGK